MSTVISASTRVPGTYVGFDFSRAGRALAADGQSVVILGQRLGGTVAALTPTDVFSGNEAAQYFGRGSQVHRMVMRAIDANSNIQLSVCALDDDPAGVAATGSVMLSGTASGTGQVRLQVAGTTVAIAVATGDKAEDLTPRLAAAFSAFPDLPVTAAAEDVVTGKDAGGNDVTAPGVVLTARNKGACGNQVGLTLTVTAEGLTGTLSPLTGGQGDPDIAPALAAIFSAGHTLIVTPYSTDEALRTLATHLDNVSGPTEQRAAFGVLGWRDSLSTGITLTGNANAKRLTVGWHNHSVLPDGELAAVYAARIVSEDDPSEPLDNLSLPGLDITPREYWPMRTEEEKALHNGLTPFRVQGSTVQVVRAISTYVKNAAGINDATLLDITTLRTLDYVRVAWRTRMAQRFPNGGKLTDHRLRQVKSETLDVLYQLESLEMVEKVQQYQDQVMVLPNKQDDTRADVSIPASVVRGLHILTGTIYLY
ncbi:phage tail protein [Salmonella enterica]|nr:phage tail protein [Salmonella enterica]EDI2719641.1 phage tail protein [Salmonella enterica subsp. enterica serovar Rubislaw]EDW1892973.1 phage tail protein [Salmonella enterica subsp. enterica serovar Abaetetuba]EED5524926.1 phage tail protein [Salmonella enterica subsp. enterica serovar Muenchen]EAO9206934.1 phage tail protein [Salmonella enterica]